MIYNFITPSDPITFIAPDDKVAFICGLLLGNGKAFCEREDGVKVDTCLLFMPSEKQEAKIKEALGGDINEFIEANWQAIADCFESFAYGAIGDRKQYDDALAAIKDPQRLAEFKDKHEERERTSMSKWVQGAWKYGKGLRKKREQQHDPKTGAA